MHVTRPFTKMRGCGYARLGQTMVMKCDVCAVFSALHGFSDNDF